MKQSKKRLYQIFVLLSFTFGYQQLKAQDSYFLTIDSLFKKAEENSVQLQGSKQKISISEENTALAKQAQLPELGASVELGSLSNGLVYTPQIKYETTLHLPHITNNYALQGSMLIFAGKALKNTIAKAKLEEQIAALDYKKDKEDIQFLLMTKYLDLYTLYNQKKVYEQNLTLAQRRLSDITKLNKQGMVTHNDIIRSQLQITDLELKIKEINNDININSNDLDITIGLPQNTIIQVDTSLYDKQLETASLNNYLDNSSAKIPEILLADQKIAAAEKDIAITKAERSPKISMFAGGLINRPFLYTLTPLDIYWMYLQVGAKMTYNISSLYTAKKKIQKAESLHHLAEISKEAMEQKADMDIHNSFIKLNEAKDRRQTLEESFLLAKDNYRIVEQKYLNQLAVLTDIIDASTALLSSQLNVTNARVNIIYQWYKLMKLSGNWDF